MRSTATTPGSISRRRDNRRASSGSTRDRVHQSNHAERAEQQHHYHQYDSGGGFDNYEAEQRSNSDALRSLGVALAGYGKPTDEAQDAIHSLINGGPPEPPKSITVDTSTQTKHAPASSYAELMCWEIGRRTKNKRAEAMLLEYGVPNGKRREVWSLWCASMLAAREAAPEAAETEARQSQSKTIEDDVLRSRLDHPMFKVNAKQRDQLPTGLRPLRRILRRLVATGEYNYLQVSAKLYNMWCNMHLCGMDTIRYFAVQC
jgi:hypothetical protein